MAIEKLLYGMSVPQSAVSNSSHNSSLSGPSVSSLPDERQAVGSQTMMPGPMQAGFVMNAQHQSGLARIGSE